MKRIVLLILVGIICVGSLMLWLKADLRADDDLTENVTAFYRARGSVPASKAELEEFEVTMKLPQVSRSFHELTITEPTPGIVRIVSSRGFVMRSHGTHEFRVGKGGANQPSQPIAGKPGSG
ncbi:MAG: hypothetical protein KBA51_04695 [Kiritimatiellae bacterium]|nr:hypothetical protein [Kiritimatiellia bacterium]